MQWSQRRRVSIAVSIVLICASLTILGWYAFVYVPPSCSDGLQNQDERGIDCEGTCARMCVIPRVDAVWSRAVKTADGVYHGVALIKNPEPSSSSTGLTYIMSLYDAGNILVAERRGSFDLTPGETRVIFEPNIITGERTPVRTLMKIDGGTWLRDEQRVSLLRTLPGTVDSEKRELVATIENTTPTTITDIVADALLYDREGILVTASETRIPTLAARARQEVVFTWPDAFSRPISTSDIVVRINVRP